MSTRRSIGRERKLVKEVVVLMERGLTKTILLDFTVLLEQYTRFSLVCGFEEDER